MKAHGFNMLGLFKGQIISTLPVWTADDEGREIYVQDEHKRYYADATSWVDYGTSGADGSSGTSGSDGSSGTSGTNGSSGTSGSDGSSGSSGNSGSSGTSGTNGTSGTDGSSGSSGTSGIGVSQITMPSFQMPYTDAELSVGSASWTTVMGGRIYIPADGRTTLVMSHRIKVNINAYGAYCRFSIGGINSSNSTHNTTTYTWYETAEADLSSLSGFYDIAVQLVCSNAGVPAYLQGFSFILE